MRIFLWFLFISITSSAQTSFEKQSRQKTLQKNLLDKEIVYGSWEKEESELHLTYLGSFKTNDGKWFKILTSKWYWGTSKRATSRILIYTAKDEYFGQYYVATICDLPYKLKNGTLFFGNVKDGCDCDAKSNISLKLGIPKTVFVACKGKQGDIWTFTKEED